MRISLIFLLVISVAHTKNVNVRCEFPKKCVKRILCSNGYIIVDGRRSINFRSGDIQIHNNYGCSSMQVCCAPENYVENTTIIEPPITTRKYGCGYSNSLGLGDNLISASNEAQIGEFPWVVIIMDKLTNDQLAGGSLLAPNVALTKAKNLENVLPNNLIVRAGEWDKRTEDEQYKHVDRQVSHIELHSRYNSVNGDFNAALLILTNSYTIAPNISPICLAPVKRNFDSLRCFVAGWGKNNFDNDYFMDVQKKIELPIINRQQCQEKLRNVGILGEDFELLESLMCAGGEKDKDACTGDGGGPLFCPMANESDRFEQVGIVNWGIQCGVEDIPAAYTSISHIRPWIDEKMMQHSVDKSYYIA